MFKKVTVEPTITTAEQIEIIHNEFNTAGDKLLKEAQEVLNKQESLDEEKVITLKNLGFVNVPEVKKVEKTRKEKELNQGTIDLILKYSLKYPSHKFITEDKIGEICKKYSLVQGDISLYKGFVPKKNLDEIVKFKQTYTFPKMAKFESYNQGFPRKARLIDIDHLIEHKSTHNDYHFLSFKKDGKGFQQSNQDYNGTSWYGSLQDKEGKFIDSGRLEIISGYSICAPIKDMDTTNMELKGYKLERHIPDPIVLRAVEGGYLIVTAWGDEASDPIVFNEKLN